MDPVFSYMLLSLGQQLKDGWTSLWNYYTSHRQLQTPVVYTIGDMEGPPEQIAPARHDLAIRLLSQGYTTRAVNFRLQDAGQTPFQESDLIRLRQQYAPEIDDLREREEIEVRARGLARRGERIRRLNKLAELLETRLFVSDPTDGSTDSQPVPRASEARDIPLKLIAEYRKLVAQIGLEADPLGIAEALDQNDPWVQVIIMLTKSGSVPKSVSNLSSQTLLESPLQEISGELSLVEQERNSSQEESAEVRVSTPPSNS